jgi:hypothetical protein
MAAVTDAKHQATPPGMNIPIASSLSYRNAITSAIVQQVIVLVLTSLILDGGDLLMFCLVACLAFWAGVAFIRLRRGQTPTKTDLILIRSSYLLLCVITFFVVHLVWKLRGLI